MSKKETRPVLLQEENKAPIEFVVDGIEFIEIDYDKEYVPARDKFVRATMKELTSTFQDNIKDTENPEIKNIWVTLEGLDVSTMLACCVKRKGEKWTKEQHLENIELFEINVLPDTEVQVIVANFFVFMQKSMQRGIQTLSKINQV